MFNHLDVPAPTTLITSEWFWQQTALECWNYFSCQWKPAFLLEILWWLLSRVWWQVALERIASFLAKCVPAGNPERKVAAKHSRRCTGIQHQQRCWWCLWKLWVACLWSRGADLVTPCGSARWGVCLSRERQSCVCSRVGLHEFAEQALGSVLDLVVPGRSLGAVSLPSGSSRAAEQMCRQRPAGCSAAPGVARKIRLCLLMIVKTCFYDNAALQLRFRTSFKRFQVTYSVTFRVINYGWFLVFSKQLSLTWLHQTLAQIETINSLSASEPLQINVHTSGFWELQNETNTKVV